MIDHIKKEVRVRMAPSPTGFMHIGTLRTVLYDYFFARQNGGKLVLRVEDTDQSREVGGAVENLLRVLDWSGIVHDEGPFLVSDRIEERGDYGPYTQSKRLSIYQKYVGQLIDAGHAYYCFCTVERLDTMRQKQQKMKQPPMYDRTCLQLELAEILERIDAGEKYVVRMKVPRGKEIIVEDVVRGRVSFSTNTVDDQVILKSDGFPTYHLAVVVDDHLMKISHILRGEEWLPSTPKHIILYEMFGWENPVFAHLPLLLSSDGKKKLSKRDGDVSVEDFMAEGYLPEAIVNFVAFLGWNPGGGQTQEIYSMPALQEIFSLEKVHKSGAVFDRVKLGKINAHYIKNYDTEALFELAMPFMKKFCDRVNMQMDFERIQDRDFLMRVLTVEQERLMKLADFGVENPFFFEDIVLEKELLVWKDATDIQTTQMLTKAEEVLGKIDEDHWTRVYLQEILMETAGEDRGSFLWPLRAALTGEKRSPSPMDCAWVLGKDTSLARIGNAKLLIIPS